MPGLRAAKLVALTWLAGAVVSGCGSKKEPPRARSKVRHEASARSDAVPKPPPRAPPPAPPAPARPPPARAADGTFTVAGLRYVELVTGGARASDALPMIVALHGHGGSGDTFQSHFRNAPFKARFIVPFGPRPLEGKSGYEWFRKVAHQQHPMAMLLPPAARRVSAAIAEIARVRPTVGKPLLTGFSQGAFMVYGMSLLRAELFSVACAMSGELPTELLASATLPPVRPEVHGFHGRQDRVVDYALGKATIQGFKRIGYNADMKTFPGLGHQFEPALQDVMRCLESGVRRAGGASAPPSSPPSSPPSPSSPRR